MHVHVHILCAWSNLRTLLRVVVMRTALQVAKLVLFLASEDASYCSGGEFTVDGGMTASQTVTQHATAPTGAPVAVEPTGATSIAIEGTARL